MSVLETFVICSGWALPAAAIAYVLANFALKLLPAYRRPFWTRYYWLGLLVSWVFITGYRWYNEVHGTLVPGKFEIFVAPFVVCLIVVFCMYNIQDWHSERRDKTKPQGKRDA